MATITFNAFSFLKKKLEQRGIGHTNETMDIHPGVTAGELMAGMGLDETEVEGIMINGKIGSFDALIQDGDRVALVPHGMPGPYRVLLGFKNRR